MFGFRLSVAALVAGTVLSAAACGVGGGSEGAGESAAGSAPAGSTPAPTAAVDHDLILATTTSTQDSGLLDVLIPMYERQTGDHVKVIAVGSGAAMELGRQGNADVLLVHSPAAEEQFVRDGYGIQRTRVMYNDFIVAGPRSDPAGVQGLRDAVEAFRRIAAARANFYSRGDRSGTHAAELALWQAAGVSPTGQPWYHETGQGMGPTITISQEKDGYTLSDRATWLSNADRAALPLLVEGDTRLFNVYHVIVVNPEKHDTNSGGAERFRGFMVSREALDVVATFGSERYGQPLFVPYTE